MLKSLLLIPLFAGTLAFAKGACEVEVENNPLAGVHELMAQLPARFSLAVWNVHKFLKPQSVSDLAELAKRSDLVLVQESVVNKLFSGDMAAQSKRMHWAFSSTFTTSEGLTGVVTGCRAFAHKNETVTSNVFEPITRTPKAMIFSQFRLEGTDDDLLVINVHAINFVNLRKFREQIWQIADRISTHQGPVLVAGDFNTWSRGRMQAMEETLSPLGVELAHSSGGRYGRYLKLDHVFTRGLKLTSISDTSAYTSSDHAPIMVQLELDDTRAIINQLNLSVSPTRMTPSFR